MKTSTVEVKLAELVKVTSVCDVLHDEDGLAKIERMYRTVLVVDSKVFELLRVKESTQSVTSALRPNVCALEYVTSHVGAYISVFVVAA